MNYFVRRTPKVSLVGKILSVRKIKTNLKFPRTSAGKSTFRTQKDTENANFRCTADKIVYFVSSAERCILTREQVATRVPRFLRVASALLLSALDTK